MNLKVFKWSVVKHYEEELDELCFIQIIVDSNDFEWQVVIDECFCHVHITK